jgi:putative endonuclease
MYYVYLLKSQTKDWLYVGYTENLNRRFGEHQKGLSEATKPYRPFELVFYEAYGSMADAKKRETYLKTNKGKRTLKLMLRESLGQSSN